jgi:hypothetical protein
MLISSAEADSSNQEGVSATDGELSQGAIFLPKFPVNSSYKIFVCDDPFIAAERAERGVMNNIKQVISAF